MQTTNNELSGQTKNCPKCGETILSSAKKCKYCQADLRNWFARHKILTGIFVFIFFLLLLGALGDGNDGNTPTETVNNVAKDTTKETPNNKKQTDKKIEYLKITADDLCREYKDNEIAADKKFKDKYLEVTGVVEGIDSDILDNPVVRLKCGGEYSFDNVSCSFASKDEAATLKKGNKITILGKGTGEVIGSPTIKDCKIK